MSDNDQKNKINDSKRKRNESELSDQDQTKGDEASTAKVSGDANTKDAPPYGSQEYWEERYTRQFRLNKVENLSEGNNQRRLKSKTEQQHHDKETVSKVDDIEPGNNEDDLNPHDWYFEYSELRPLIFPLLLGGRDDFNEIMAYSQNDPSSDSDDDENDDIQQCYEIKGGQELGDQSSGIVSGSLNQERIESLSKSGNEDENAANNVDDINNSDNSDGSEASEYLEIEDCSDDDETSDECIRDGLAKNGPIRILEVGCGDRPLGVGMAQELRKLQLDTGALACNIVSEIICIDYSQTVIDAMNKLYSGGVVDTNGHKRKDVDSVTCESKDPNIVDLSKEVALKFAVADARSLPFENSSFEFILEKGTLDAMLSDNDCGASNCIQIVTEIARLLTPNMSTNDPSVSSIESTVEINASSNNGCLLLVSHLNANTERGMSWLKDVIIAGLLQYSQVDQLIEWEIDVHGKSEVDKNDDQSNDEVESIGPAVYLIHKRLKKSNDILQPIEEESKMDGNTKQNIPINFFSY